MLVLDTPSFQPPEKFMTTHQSSGKDHGLNTEKLTHTTKIAESQNPTTGKEPNNAHNLGNAEVQDSVKEEDGALVMMDAKVLHFQTKPQVLPPIAEYKFNEEKFDDFKS